MVAVTRISSTLFIRFLYYNVQSLLGVNLNLDFFFELFSSVYFSFLMFGVIGVAPLSSYVSKHSILKNCNVGIPCLLEKLSLLWSTCFELTFYAPYVMIKQRR